MWEKELTCKQDSKLVSRNRDNSRLCGAWQCSLRLQFQLNHRFIHLPQFTGAQSVVDPPGHSVQSPNWNWLRSRIDGTRVSVSQCSVSSLAEDSSHHQLRVFLFKNGQNRQKYLRLRLVCLSLSCSVECLSSYDLQSPVVCSTRIVCVIKG